MDFFAAIEDKWNLICEKTKPFRESVVRGAKKFGKTVRYIWSYLYRMRTVFLAVPVGVAAVVLAIQNLARLPDSVGIWLLTNGEFYMLVPKALAVVAPLAVTALSILLLLGSKKVLYPWMISVFTLVLPFLIYITNIFPM